MIDCLSRCARRLQFLRLPVAAVGWLGLFSVVAALLPMSPVEGDQFLLPAVLVLLWALTCYCFLVTFRFVPRPEHAAGGLLMRLGYRFRRFGYGLLGLVFVGMSLAVVVTSIRLVTIWWGDYAH